VKYSRLLEGTMTSTFVGCARRCAWYTRTLFLDSRSNLTITQAEEAMAAKEVPVGCVFVRDDKIIAKARNRTNELRNARPPSF